MYLFDCAFEHHNLVDEVAFFNVGQLVIGGVFVHAFGQLSN